MIREVRDFKYGAQPTLKDERLWEPTYIHSRFIAYKRESSDEAEQNRPSPVHDEHTSCGGDASKVARRVAM